MIASRKIVPLILLCYFAAFPEISKTDLLLAMIKKITIKGKNALLETLKLRFNTNKHIDKSITWEEIALRIIKNDSILHSLNQMEITGGEPNVIAHDKINNRFLIVDCSPESPSGRRSLCYDKAGMLSRKEHLPASNAIEMATAMGVELLNEEQYMLLQKLGSFDTKTSSWLKTPEELRKLGGALFGDKRFGRVFVYHNGAQSYYGSRGFRAAVWI